jgi:hypothetical protein
MDEFREKVAKGLDTDQEWYKSASRDTYLELYDLLVQHMSPEKAYELLAKAYYAAADEYGA